MAILRGKPGKEILEQPLLLPEQIEGVAGWQPLFSVGGQSFRWDYEAQVGMILHLSSPGLEHGGKIWQLGADEARIFCQFFDSAD